MTKKQKFVEKLKLRGHQVIETPASKALDIKGMRFNVFVCRSCGTIFTILGGTFEGDISEITIIYWGGKWNGWQKDNEYTCNETIVRNIIK